MNLLHHPSLLKQPRPNQKSGKSLALASPSEAAHAHHFAGSVQSKLTSTLDKPRPFQDYNPNPNPRNPDHE
ncbi:hypothetical protein DSO57_1003166 [Entomophthora muscae]|uniref:Uncharacterized protein n=1 Tax=Entomophthora muscae TaxID=34485 RepID=A0ACC2RNF0_9FUNG|nr:hypothetical protein DSO57_1003166 [Entomophthora muscae]